MKPVQFIKSLCLTKIYILDLGECDEKSLDTALQYKDLFLYRSKAGFTPFDALLSLLFGRFSLVTE